MIQQNQLQFNLDVPSLPDNLAAQYHHPGPLVIEKLGGDVPSKKTTGSGEPKPAAVPSVKFTALSEDRLSTAIRLAKLDLKNILSKSPETIRHVRQLQPEQKQSKKSKSKRSPSGKKHRQSRDPNLRIRERYANPNENQRSIETQTPTGKRRHGIKDGLPWRPSNTSGLVLNVREPDRHIEVKRGGGGPSNRVSLSPPTKDVSLSPNSQQAKEIRRVRLELKSYMTKIEELSEKASQQRQNPKKEEEDIEDKTRREARAAEQASRSARLLYSLQRQVREIQEELDRFGPGKVRHTKKSRALTRLAAAHRGAVRALQSFLHHLPSEMDPGGGRGGGLPPHYRELALLIRQLSLCCSQLDVEESGIPEGVLNILEQAKDFQEAISEQVSSIPPRPKPKPKPTTQRSPSPRRRLAFEDTAREPFHKPQPRPKASQDSNNRQHILREVATKDSDVHRDTPQVTPGHTTVERLRQSAINKATPGSPERNEALRAGLEALLRAGRRPPGPARPTKQVPQPTQQLPRSMPDQGPHGLQPAAAKARRPQPAKRPAPSSRSLILPANLKAARERLQRARPIPRDAHFTQETVASKLKHREPVSQQSGADPETGGLEEGSVATPKPAWTPPGSPKSFHKVSSPRPRHVEVSSEEEDESVKDKKLSPRRRKVVFNVDEPRGDADDVELRRRLDPELMQRETARQAWLDREAAKQLKDLDAGHGPVRHHPPVPPGWLEEVEKALADRLRPLIDKAETTAREQQHLQNASRQSLHHQLSQKAVQATSNNADLLSDLLLEDILADTALEFHHIDSQEELERQARQLQDAPTIEGMLQSLEKMELMEEDIRRRWKRVEFIDKGETPGDSIQQKESKWMMGTPLDGEFLESFAGAVPTTHTSMKFTNVVQHDDHQSRPSLSSGESSDGPETPPQADARIHSSDDDKDYRLSAVSNGDPEETDRHLSQDVTVGGSGATIKPSHHLGILQSLLDPKTTVPNLNQAQSRDSSGIRPRLLDRPKFPAFIPSDMMKRIKEHRGRFEHHLKTTSHWAYGTFDPWRLVEEVSDEIVTEIITSVSSEVKDIMGHYVDDLYEAEFDMTQPPDDVPDDL